LNKYEALIIFPSQLKDEELKPAIERVEKEIDRAEGVRIGTEVAGKRGFARTMQKRDSGIYVRFGFEMNPAAMAGFRARLKLQETIFRSQVIRVEEPLVLPERRQVEDVSDDPYSYR
jgi:small subunit ribosomal protein S6